MLDVGHDAWSSTIQLLVIRLSSPLLADMLSMKWGCECEDMGAFFMPPLTCCSDSAILSVRPLLTVPYDMTSAPKKPAYWPPSHVALGPWQQCSHSAVALTAYSLPGDSSAAFTTSSFKAWLRASLGILWGVLLHLPVLYSVNEHVGCLLLGVVCGRPDKSPLGQLLDGSGDSCSDFLLSWVLAFTWEQYTTVNWWSL